MRALNLRSKIFVMALGLLSASASFAQGFNLPPVVADASEYYIRGCEVKLNVSGRYNQLYVNGSFSGNFEMGIQDNYLAQTIYNHLQRGSCSYKSQYELQYLRNPALIQDFANFRYQNCYVKMYVDGRYNQMYVRNRFVGNYLTGYDDAQLRSVLTGYIVNGTCVPANFPPNPNPQPTPFPQGCTCSIINQWGSFIGSGPNCDLAVRSVINSCANSHPQAVCRASEARCR